MARGPVLQMWGIIACWLNKQIIPHPISLLLVLGPNCYHWFSPATKQFLVQFTVVLYLEFLEIDMVDIDTGSTSDVASP